ncbi:M6 family metalloprotease domain-containing protein [bacterium]|nr:M6 family metalloprotease domain-containing protein [bacterium]
MRHCLPLMCLLLVALCLPPVLARPSQDGLLTQIASHAQAGERVLVDVYDPGTRQLRQVDMSGLTAYAMANAGRGGGPELMPPHPRLLRDGAVGTRALATYRRLVKKPGLEAPGWGPGAADRLHPLAAGAQPVAGTWRALVLLVDFSDKTPTLYPGTAGATHFNSMLFDSPAYTNSLQDYYREVSRQAFTLNGSAVGGTAGWYRAPQTNAYYVNNNAGLGTYPQNSQKLVEDVAALADPDVDFSQYANDGSDYINALFVVHAGMGQEESGDATDIWSHKWQTYTQPVLDGKTLSVYSIEPENGLVGVFAHEFGHVLGLPDLYDYGYDSTGVGDWSLMAFGSWGGGGALPTQLDAFCRVELGWVDPVVPTSSQINVSFPQIEGNPVGSSSGVIYKLWCGTPTNEYWLVENRQQVGFDVSLPSSGLLIWHIDEDMPDNDTQWYPGLNALLGHYLVALEQADGLWELEHYYSFGDSGDPYHDSITGFGPLTTPNSNTYESLDSLIGVRNISSSGTVMTADLDISDPAPGAPRSPIAADTAGDSGGSITVSWSKSTDDGRGYNDVVKYEVWRSTAADGTFEYLGDVLVGGRTYVDLVPANYVDYYYKIFACDAVNKTPSKVTSAAQARDDIAPDAVTCTAADTPTDDGGSITISWSSYAPPADFLQYRVYRSESDFENVTADGVTLLKTFTSAGTKGCLDATTEDDKDYYYAVTCVDTSIPGNERTAVEAAGPARSNPNYGFSFPSGLSLIGIGLTLQNNQLSDVFDLSTGLQFARWNPALGTDGQYVVYTSGSTDSFLRVSPGRGFWMRGTSPVALSLSGSAATSDVRVDFSVGWNQLGNPYVSDVDVSAEGTGVRIGGTFYTLTESNERKYTRDFFWIYDTSANSYKLVSPNMTLATKVIKKGAGFFFLSQRAGQLVLKKPDAASAAAVATTSTQAPADEWSLRLAAAIDGAADTDNFLGVSSRAAALTNVVSPPAAGDGPDLYFSGSGGRTATDYVESLGAGHTWTVDVACARPEAAIKLTWPDLSALPRDVRPVLTDTVTGRSIYMRTVSSYVFTLASSETSRRLNITIGAGAGSALVLRSTCTQGASGNVRVAYTLTTPATVGVEVRNVAGRLVRQLGGSSVSPAGSSEILWNCTSASGQRVPAGQYLVCVTGTAEDGQVVRAIQTVQVRR